MIARPLIWVPVLTGLGIVVAVGVVTFAVADIFGATPGGNDSPPAEGHSSSQDQQGTEVLLGACLSVLDSSVSAQLTGSIGEVQAAAEAGVTDALEIVSLHEYWDDAGYGNVSPSPDSACPSLPLPMRVGQGTWINGHRDPKLSPPPASSTLYRVSVYVMSLEDIDHILGGTKRRMAPQDYVCDIPNEGGYGCRQVTTAIYVTPEEVSDTTLLTDLLEKGFGLELPQ